VVPSTQGTRVKVYARGRYGAWLGSRGWYLGKLAGEASVIEHTADGVVKVVYMQFAGLSSQWEKEAAVRFHVVNIRFCFVSSAEWIESDLEVGTA
jgi:hypothetical protein